MATKKNLRWETKNSTQKKLYGTKTRQTDYDIPSFGYKSAIYMMLIFIVTFITIPMVCRALRISAGWPTTILGGLICGFSVAYLQFVREKKEGISRQFWIVGGMLSLVFSAIIYILFFYAIMI